RRWRRRTVVRRWRLQVRRQGRRRGLQDGQEGLGGAHTPGGGRPRADRTPRDRAPRRVERYGRCAASRRAVISGRRRALLSFSAARFTTKRAEESAITSTSSRSFAASVAPVSTTSTTASARPERQASSTLPESATTSAGLPRRLRYSAVMRGYLLA